jgi:ABC-type glycerol-3-phosphate transport system permease component
MHAMLALCALGVIFPVAWIGVAAFKSQIALLTGKVLRSHSRSTIAP